MKSKTMTRADELRVIEEMKALFRKEEACAEIGQWLHDAINDDIKMAMQDAQWDALGTLPEKHGKQMTGIPSGDLAALLMAAMVRCLTTRCPHAVMIPGCMRYVFLASRLCSCKECLPSFLSQFAEHDARQDHAGECDLCLTQGVQQFCAIHLAYNGAVFIGDVCPACRELFSKKS